MMRLGMVVVATVTVAASGARADRNEATIVVRPSGQLARLADVGTADRAVVVGGGVMAGLSWGALDWLDIGAELAAGAYGKATHESATLRVLDTERTGALIRTTRSAQLRGTAIFRLGVVWVPTIQLGLGGGGRLRSAARLRVQPPVGDAIVFDPDGEEAELAFDLVAAIRLGLERRVTPRWSIGASIGASQNFGLGVPDMQTVDASVALSYTWYPLL